MRELMDEVEIEPSERGTTVKLRRRLRGDGAT
jgi:anti-sigma regulatory factor (Ser/Thr protein kinase)